MSYALGIDLGTSYAAAAVWRDGRAQTVPLGNRAHSIPSAVFLRPDGVLLVGEAAVRRGISQPERLARGFKRRFGDATPYWLGDEQLSPQELTGHLIRWVTEKVTEQEGGPPAHVTLTCPATWRDHERRMITEAAGTAQLTDVGLLPEPVAAAVYYASQARLETGAMVAVYDLGGGTFDAAVVVKTPTGFEVRGTPGGNERIGGEDFDEVVMNHVATTLRVAWDQLDTDDPVVLAGLTQVRQNAVEAKESLSTDVDTAVPVILPDLVRDVRLTRGEFESAIRIPLLQTVHTLADTIAAAGVQPAELATVLLIGGSSRIPLVSRLIAQELGVPVAVDAHPKYAVCLGAAISAAVRLQNPAPAFSRAAETEPDLGEAPVSSAPAGAELLVEQPAVRADPESSGLQVPADLVVHPNPPRGLTLPRITDRDQPLVVVHGGNPIQGRRIALIVTAALAVVIGVVSVFAVIGGRNGPGAGVPVPTTDASRPTTTSAPSRGGAAILNAQPIASRPGDVVRAVIGTTGGLLAVGESTTDGVPRAWEFRGDRWRELPGPSASTRREGAMNGVADQGRTLVAVGWLAPRSAGQILASRRQAAVWTSTDGTNWTLAATPAVGELFDVVAVPGAGFLATGTDWSRDKADGDAVLLASADGRSWRPVPATGLDGPGPTVLRRLLLLGNGGALAVGTELSGGVSRSELWRSADRRSWAPVFDLPDASNDGQETNNQVVSSAWGMCRTGSGSLVLVGAAKNLAGQAVPLIWSGTESRVTVHPVAGAQASSSLYAVTCTGSTLTVVGSAGAGSTSAAVWGLHL